MKDIYFITFYTDGTDGCLNLTDTAIKIENELSKYFTKMFFFNKSKLKELPDSDEICNVHKNEHSQIYFPNSHKMGYLDWKPFIIQHILTQIPENSILLYHDCNFEKYPNYWKSDWENIYNVCEYFLNENKSDFWLKYELNDFYLKKSAKTYTIDTLFTNPIQNQIVKESLQINASQIIIRNTNTSRIFIDEWLELCKDKTLISPIPNPNPHPELEISGCAEQDVLNCLIYRYIFEDRLKPSFPMYGLNWRVLRLDKIKFEMNGMTCETGPYKLENTEIINYLKK